MDKQDNTFAQAQRKLEQARDLAAANLDLQRTALREIMALAPALAEGGSEKLADLEAAAAQLEEGIRNPVLRVAAIGTTSSAKSSLLNFLCGAEILPTGLQEKSAGVTRIRHGQTPALRIEESAGALWVCGDCEVSGARDIYDILEAVMDCYREAAGSGEDLEAPSFTVTWPLAAASVLEIPPDFQFELLDLPGLRYSGDERNRKVIGQCRDALSIVAFGAHETDPVKQAVFLEDALEQINFIGAPLERMFFLATRGDEFLLKDSEHWPDNEDSFMAERLEAIKTGILDMDPQIDVSGLALARLSPQPALLCWRLADGEERADAWKKIQKSYLGLVTGGAGRDPEAGIDIWSGLSASKYTLWNEEDWGSIIQQLLETTGAAVFLESLQTRLAENLPAIVLPPACANYISVAADTAQWAHSGAELARTHIRGDMEKHIAMLNEAVQEQERINTQATARLEAFFDDWLNLAFGSVRDKGVGNLPKAGGHTGYEADWAELAEKYPQFPAAQLKEIGDWAKKIESAFLRPVECAAANLVEDKAFPASLPLRAKLENCCRILRKHEYRGLKAKSGVNFETPGLLPGDSSRQARTMREIEDNFEKLQKYCDESALLCTEAAINQLMEKIVDALENLQNSYLSFLNSQASSLPAEIRNVAIITPRGLEEFTEAKLNFTKTSRARVEKRRLEEKREKEVSNLMQGDGLGPMLVNLFRTLTGNATIKKVIKLVRLQVKLPPVAKLKADYASEYRRLSPQLMERLREASRQKMREFLVNIEDYQNNLFEAYRQNLRKSAGEKAEDAGARERELDRAVADLEKGAKKLAAMRKLYA